MDIVNKSSKKVESTSPPSSNAARFREERADTQRFGISSGQLVPIEESLNYDLPEDSEWTPAWIVGEDGLPRNDASLGLCDITHRSAFGKYLDPETGRVEQGFRVGGKTLSGRQTRTVDRILEDTPALGVPNRQYHTGHHKHHQDLPFARVTVYRDYMEVKRVQPAFSDNGGGLRSAIQGYSKKSYRNLQKKQAQVRADPSHHLTLTFPDYAPQLEEIYQYDPIERVWMPLSLELMCVLAFVYGGVYMPYGVLFNDDIFDFEYDYPKDWLLFGWELSQRYLDSFWKRFDRKFEGYSSIWKKEIQDRKSGKNIRNLFIHYHAQLYGVVGIYLRSFQRWCKVAWLQIIDPFIRLSAAANGEDYEVYRRYCYRAGVRADRIFDHAHMSRYVAKYAAKESRDNLEIGRRWGVRHEENLDCSSSGEYDIDLQNYLDLRETVKRWAILEGRAKYRNFFMALLDDYNRGFFAFGLGDNPNDKAFEGQIYIVLDISQINI